MDAPDTIIELLRSRADEEAPGATLHFLGDGDTVSATLSWRELDRRARAIGAALQARFGPGDRLLLWYPPGLEFLCAFFGVVYAGMIAVPAYPPRPQQLDARLRAILDDAGAAAALTTADLEARLAQQVGTAGVECVATDTVPDDLGAAWLRPAVTGDTLAHLQYTSGSTATPKGVMVSHRNLLQNLRDMDLGWRHDGDSVIVTWLPHFHDMGLVYGLLEPIYAGVPCFILSPVAFIQKPVRWLKAITRFGATHSCAPNFAYDLCVRRIRPEDRGALDLSRWRVAVNGAEPIRQETLARFAETFAPQGFEWRAFCPGYGLAEATLKVTASQSGEAPVATAFDEAALERGRVVPAGDGPSRTLMGCGVPLLDTTVVIADRETGARADADRVGEIWVSGTSVAAGYWRRPDETAAVFGARLSGSGEGPFLRTGDLGFVYDGQLYVAGRLKDLIIIRGQNHYPQDVEQTVEGSHPALRPLACAAFAVDVDGDERLVVVQEVEREARTADPVEIVGAIRQAVSETHELQVHDVVLLKSGAVPKTSSGKIQRQAIKAAWLAGTLEGRL